ncbi:unnamed protein product (macronuclear) [Paramecium tetraurelia]|uniref:3-hydroxyisobutyrate dehydrogenase n=1 Tax=Paramecium tetraurelia TaxID=5888 RepID=A0C2T7_PARTE|nr:uncharacterized protein GSPATT00034582001 [Paramecium tetraurelia]CAK65104.1 unnamed protein product [Paramecium tetraurelia]|eukprot:XP_001432501.1 hypothetical protein (macronuclear) [Paramecium tetraurelia strain d4-2]
MRKFISAFGFSNTIGFIGLGNMGIGMAHNLAKTRVVYAYDVSPAWQSNIESSNIKPVNQVADVAANADTIITMLPNDKIVKSVAQEIFKKSKKILIDSSTISPYTSYELAKMAQDTQNIYADAPVSGSVSEAKLGTITFMVGAEKELYEKISPILKEMGKNIFNCGKIGEGQIAKMCGNMALAIQMISVCEALALGKNMGMDPAMLSSIMSVSSSRCWTVDTYNPAPGVMPNVPSNKDYDGGFMVELMLKDLGIGIEASRLSGTDTQLGQHAYQIYNKLNEHLGKKDFAIVYKELIKCK